MKSILTRFFKDTSGATAVEYGLISALIAVALIGGATTLGNAIDNSMVDMSNHLKNSQK